MNAFITTDIENSIILMKAAIMNALHDIDSGSEKYIDLGKYISVNLLYKCLRESNWDIEYDEEYNGWQLDFWWIGKSPSGKPVIIEGCLFGGQSFVIKINDDNE